MKKNLTEPVFISPGANIDAVETAGRFGIDADRAADCVPDSKGAELNFRMMGEAAAASRECGAVPAVCPDEIREDMKKRGNPQPPGGHQGCPGNGGCNFPVPVLLRRLLRRL